VLLRQFQAVIHVGGEQGRPGGLDRLVGSIRALARYGLIRIGLTGRPLGSWRKPSLLLLGLFAWCASPKGKSMGVELVTAPAAWDRFFYGSGCHVVPAGMKRRDVLQRRSIASDLQQLLGKSFEVQFQPNGTLDENDDSFGHVITVGYTSSESLAEAAFDLRENYREQLAEWFSQFAAELCAAAGKLRANNSAPPVESTSDSIVTIFEVVEVVTGKILHRSLHRADCLRFQVETTSRCFLRNRDAILCSPQVAGGAA